MVKKDKYQDERLREFMIERLQQLRNANQLSQEAVIESTHLDISRYETGNSIPTIPSVLKLCKFYHISLAEFFAPMNYPEKA